MPGPGNEILEGGDHLAAIADTQGKGILAGEKLTEGVAQAGVEQHALGPALPGPQHVAVGEAAAGHQPPETGQVLASGEQVAHVHIESRKTGPVEGRGHLHLPVYALLPQDGHGRAHPGGDIGGTDILLRIEAQRHRQARISGGDALILLAGTFGVVPQGLYLVAGTGPQLLQARPRVRQQVGSAAADGNDIARGRLAQQVQAVSQAQFRRPGAEGGEIGPAQLHYRAGFLTEQLRQRLPRQRCQVQLQAAVAGEGHFQQGHQQAPVGAVVIGQ